MARKFLSKDYAGTIITRRDSDFAIQEFVSGYMIIHKATGRDAWLGDGVDMFFTATGKPISPGTPSWRNAARSWMIDAWDEIYDAYFPNLWKD